MQRQRPRLKQFLIECSLPGCTKRVVKLYPTRPSARSRIHHTYCCPEHGKRHWAQLRRQQLAEDAQPYQCAGPDCTVMIEPAFTPGRRKLYHNDACRERAKTARRRRASANDVQHARAKALAATQRAEAAHQAAEEHRAAFTRWYETVYADVARRWQGLKQRAADKGKTPRPKEWFIDLMEETLQHYRERQELQDGLDRVARIRNKAAQLAAEELQRVEARLDRRAATARRRRAQGHGDGPHALGDREPANSQPRP